MRQFKIFLFFLFAFLGVAAFAQTPAPANPDLDFFSQVSQAVSQFGGMSWMLKIASICLLIVASMKVSFLAPLWEKLGALQTWVAPVLGLIAGVLSLGTGLSFPSAIAYIFAGAGAVLLHQLLDSVKAIPGLGAIYVSIISFIEAIPVIGSGAPPAK